MSEAPASAATSRSRSASESTVVAEFVPDAVERDGVPVRGRAEREFIKLLQAQAYEYLPITSEAAARRQPPHAARGAERHQVHRRRVGAVLHRADRRRERRHRREDGPHPGGPRPGPQARRRHDQEHHADRQDRTSTTTGCRSSTSTRSVRARAAPSTPTATT